MELLAQIVMYRGDGLTFETAGQAVPGDTTYDAVFFHLKNARE